MQPGAKTPADAVRAGVERQRQVRDGVQAAVKAMAPTEGRSPSDVETDRQGVNAGRESR